jgi:predicted DNA-binding transcriptional regulator YafY
MMLIHHRLKGGGFPNYRKLSDEIEVCERTIKRDIDFMKVRLNLPIEYDARRYGFYYSRLVEEFPSVPITEAEIFALLVAHKAIAQYQGTPFQAPLETAFRKLSGQLNDQHQLSAGNLEQALSFRPFAPESTDLENFETLSQSIQGSLALTFHYRKLGAERAQKRKVHPYHLTCFDNRWYLVAHDTDRESLRTFALARMSRLEIVTERFKRPKDFNIEEYLSGSFGIFNSDKDFEAVIHFDKWAAQLIRERRWHPTQELTDLPKGCIRLRLRLNNLEELKRWVLSWGTHATVVRPKALCDAIRDTAAALAKAYAPRGS